LRTTTVNMRLETSELGIDLDHKGRAYLESAVFDALHHIVSRVGLVNVCLRRSGTGTRMVTCVMAAQMFPSGRVVVALRASHPYEAIDRAVAQLRRQIGGLGSDSGTW